jgi:hypothetical protein
MRVYFYPQPTLTGGQLAPVNYFPTLTCRVTRCTFFNHLSNKLYMMTCFAFLPCFGYEAIFTD